MVRRVWVLILLFAVGVEAGPPKGWAVRVLDAEGGPASGTLTVVGFAERHELTLGKNGVADLEAADIYALERYRVFARRGGFCTRLVTVPPRGKGLELRLEPGGVFEATVSDRAGKTIAGAELAFFVMSVPSSTPPLFSARTGKAGTVRIAGLPLDTELQAVVVGYRGGLLLGGPVKRDKGLRWGKPGEVQKGDVSFDPPTGRVVRYRFECAKPKVDLPDSVVFHAVGDEEAMSGSVQVEKLPAEALVFVPKDCPPLLFQLGLIGDQRATDMQPGAGGKKKAIVFSGESVVVVRARDPKGRPLRFGAWHVRVWFLENGESKRYPRESSASAGDGLHVVKLCYPRELLGMQRHALRFELRAGKPRSECYPAMPGGKESVTVSGTELLRRLLAGKRWQVDLTAPVLRKPAFFCLRSGQ